MTGLETILHAITSDAETAAAEELEQARQKADTILTEAKAEGAKKAQIILQEGESEAQEIRERAKSAAQLDFIQKNIPHIVVRQALLYISAQSFAFAQFFILLVI